MSVTLTLNKRLQGELKEFLQAWKFPRKEAEGVKSFDTI